MACAASRTFILGVLSILFLVSLIQTTLADDQTIRLRIAWGGGNLPTSWEGRISVQGGRLVDPQLLGVEADAPGSMWLDNGELHIGRRTPRLYDGVDITAIVPDDARLIVKLTSDKKVPTATVDIRLSELRIRTHRTVLDDQKNYLLVNRAPGDNLRVEIERDTMIFYRDETFRCSVEPDINAMGAHDAVEITATLRHARSGHVSWSKTYSVKKTSEETVPPPRIEIETPLTVEEGVYNLELAASPVRGFAGRFVPRVGEKPLAARLIQLVVIDSQRVISSSREEWQTVAEIDPTNPRWWNRLPKWMRVEQLPGMPQGVLTNWPTSVRDLHMGNTLKLPARDGDREPTWWAYPLPVEAVGMPHMLEIDLPGKEPIELGVSIMEPDAAGRLNPTGRDLAIHQDTANWSGVSSTHQTYRYVFWPRTPAPLLVLSSLHHESPAMIGRIRIVTRSGKLPVANTDGLAGISGRLVAGAFDKPLIAEAFGASGIRDPLTGLAIDDWQTFYESSTRLAEYLRFAGYNAAVVTVLGDGSSLFPSRQIEGSLLYDSGLLSSLAQDPMRKDCLKLFLEVFDREGLAFIPSLDLNSPLPELEEMRRESQPQHDGIEWVGVDGRTWLQVHGVQRGKAPYYNLLNPNVQETIIKLVREISQRYSQHPSLSGIALQLGDTSYMQLPGAEWGFDDATIARFQQDTEIEVPGKGAGRFQQRAAFLLGPQQTAWLRWRAECVAEFYDQLRKEVGATNPRRVLYITPARALDDPAVRRLLDPALPECISLDRQFLEKGLDWKVLDKKSEVIVVQTYFDGTGLDDPRGSDLRINGALHANQSSESLSRHGVQLFARSRQISLPSLQQYHVFGPNVLLPTLNYQTRAIGIEARKNLVRILAARDAAVLFDGGSILPTAYQSDLLRVLDIYQRLPHPSKLAATKTRQPVVLRIYDEPSATVMCVVNDSPWPVDVTIPLRAPAGCTMIELPYGNRPATVPAGEEKMQWRLQLAPYDIAAARFSESGARANEIALSIKPDAQALLAEAIDDLGQRATAMAKKRAYGELMNPNFELPSNGMSIPGWQLASHSSGTQWTIDDKNPFEGSFAGRLSSTGLPVSIVSDPFPTPETGRLTVHARIRAVVPNPQPELRIIVEEIGIGEVFRQYTVLGGHDARAVPMQRDWVYYEFPIENLPTENGSRLRLRFELLGAGTTWVDGINLFDLSLAEEPGHNERLELFKIVYKAKNELENDRYSDCVHILEGYWPKFLRRHVHLETAMDIRQAKDSPPQAEPDVADRLKQIVPKFLRR